MIYKIFAILAAVLGLVAYFPYMQDILAGKVQPARSVRIMFVLLLSLSLWQQHALGSRLALGVTIGELIGSIAILFMSLTRGVGGLKRLDIICYALLIIDVFFWLTSKNALIALHLTVLADIIAFTPTLEKTWRNPASETAPFFVIGVIAAAFSILAAQDKSYAIILYPLSLVIFNGLEVLLIKRGGKTA
jgi:hypothetical protein